MGNLFSVEQACIYVGLTPCITSDKQVLFDCDAAILPGVGAFGESMKNLHRFDLVSPLKEFIASGKQFMGICLGFQLLFSESEEFGNHKGLDIFPGIVKRFSENKIHTYKIKIPQVGWNNIKMESNFIANRKNISPLSSIHDNEYMYFVHSYYVQPAGNDIIATTTNYADIQYCSSIFKGNVFASQFHPEKSAHEGIKIYKIFAKSI